MYGLKVKPDVDKIFSKLAKKDKALLEKVDNKITDILNNPLKRYKFLKGKQKGINRVHVANHFVLVFKIDHETETITILHFAHHDDAYE